MPHRKVEPKRSPPPPTVSGRWLLIATSLALVAAAACAWITLCLLFWQGSWQLLYHPAPAVSRTPASVGLAFDPVAFAATEAGAPRLKGWWTPAGPSTRSRYTVLYLHGQDGNLSNAVDDLDGLHAVGVNVLAFDYRGYGQSQFVHPSEARWHEDAEWALSYLTATRHVNPETIIVDGRDLGANLALEVAAAHPELAGVVLESPLDSPANTIFNDPRAHLVPAHLLVSDRFDATHSATALRIPSLWLAPERALTSGGKTSPAGYDRVASSKMLVWLTQDADFQKQRADACSRWLDELSAK
jgi:pimeloyl-ACP methyl ester carboxylesterase